MNALVQQGVWMADEDTMTAAIHNVYCGIMADHDETQREGSRSGPDLDRRHRPVDRSRRVVAIAGTAEPRSPWRRCRRAGATPGSPSAVSGEDARRDPTLPSRRRRGRRRCLGGVPGRRMRILGGDRVVISGGRTRQGHPSRQVFGRRHRAPPRWTARPALTGVGSGTGPRTAFPALRRRDRAEREQHPRACAARSTPSTALKAATVIAWYEHELQGAGYATDALNGPMEDGSYTLDMTGQPAGCRLEVAAAPMGGASVLGITVRYGAGCPNS